MYRDTDEDMYDRTYYVLTDENNVYKCIFNNKGGASTVKPTGFSTSSFTTSDGYTWKYMYTISLGDANKFLTSVHMPVKTITASDGSTESDRQLAVQNAAVNGAIEVIETVNVGSGYLTKLQTVLLNRVEDLQFVYLHRVMILHHRLITSTTVPQYTLSQVLVQVSCVESQTMQVQPRH
jgi:hypothetical protein